MNNLIFESYLDYYQSPPVWRWRGIDGETKRVIIVNSSDTFDSAEAAARGAMDFIHSVMGSIWTLHKVESENAMKENKWLVVRAK